MFKKFFVAVIVILIVAAVFWGYRYYFGKPGAPSGLDQAFPFIGPSGILDKNAGETPAKDDGIEVSSLRIPDFEEKDIFFQPKKQSEDLEKAIMTEEAVLGLQVPSFPISFEQFFPKPSAEESQKSQPSSAQDFLKQIQEAVSGAERKIEERSVSAPIETSPGASRQKIDISTKEIKLSLTPEEFNILYPDYFMKNLQEIQVFIKSYDPDYQIITEIKTDSDVRRVQENIVFTLFSANMITKDEAERYLTTIRFTLPQLQISELEIKGARGAGISRYSASLKLSAVYEFIGKLWQFNAIPAAKAKGPCGACMILPECFQIGAPNPALGPNTWTPFCYCIGCFFGQGCLDRCIGQSAIWDPMTGICGCG